MDSRNHDVEKLAEALSKKVLFVGLAEGELKKIAALAEVRRYRPGETVTEHGDLDASLYVILDGEVEVVAGEGADGRIVACLSGSDSLMRQYEGDFFGEMAFLDYEPRSALVRARGEATLARIDAGASRGGFGGSQAGDHLSVQPFQGVKPPTSPPERAVHREGERLKAPVGLGMLIWF